MLEKLKKELSIAVGMLLFSFVLIARKYYVLGTVLAIASIAAICGIVFSYQKFKKIKNNKRLL